MGFFRRRQNADVTAEPPQPTKTNNSVTTLQWEFGAPEVDRRGKAVGLDPHLYTLQASPAVAELVLDYADHRPQREWNATPLTKPWREDAAETRLGATQNALDQALEQWWSDGTLPPLPLLRDGLLALEAGHELDEGQRTLLLRTALTYQRCMITALRYQPDGERTAFMLKEMLLNLQTPLPPALIWQLRQEDEQSAGWVSVLLEELQYELPLVEGLQFHQTQTTLEYLEGKRVPEAKAHDIRSLTAGFTDLASAEPLRAMMAQPYWSYGRLLVITLFAILVTSMVLMRWQLSSAAGAITIPADTYPLLSADETQLPRLEPFSAYAIDRTEVTNQAYQRCYRAGVCPPLPVVASVSRPDYFRSAAFADFPVVNVTWQAAQAYCAWQGKELPTAEQWQVAASIAPATRRAFRYPWGDPFDRLLANTAASNLGDTQPAGSYDPNGNSGFGLMDMAGNVAEWTATPVIENSQEYIVKGGSFRDDPALAINSAQQALDARFYAPWLGFRCSVGD